MRRSASAGSLLAPIRRIPSAILSSTLADGGASVPEAVRSRPLRREISVILCLFWPVSGKVGANLKKIRICRWNREEVPLTGFSETSI